MLSADKKYIVGFALLDALEQSSGELHQAARLTEAFILLEQSDKMFERGMEWVGLPYLLGNLLDARGDNVTTIFSFFDLLGIFLGNVRNSALVGKLVDQAFLEDLIDFIARQLDRRNGHGLATSFLLKVVNCFGQCLGLSLVAA